MPWTIETLNEGVDAELDALPASIRARMTRIFELIEAVGLEQVREPHIKHLEGKRWEIRAKAKDGIARAVYVTVVGQRLVIVHAFVKKSHKTPKHNLEMARQRAKEVQQ